MIDLLCRHEFLLCSAKIYQCLFKGLHFIELEWDHSLACSETCNYELQCTMSSLIYQVTNTVLLVKTNMTFMNILYVYKSIVICVTVISLFCYNENSEFFCYIWY